MFGKCSIFGFANGNPAKFLLQFCFLYFIGTFSKAISRIELYPASVSKQPLNVFLIVIWSELAGFRPNSEIIGKFQKLKKLYGHFVKRQK